MFYLIRINRRDKPHSRKRNDDAAERIPASVTKGQISITEKTGEKRCLATPRRTRVCSTQNGGPERSALLDWKPRQLSGHSGTALPHPSFSQASQPAAGLGESGATRGLAGRCGATGGICPARVPGQAHTPPVSGSRGMMSPRTFERTNVPVLRTVT